MAGAMAGSAIVDRMKSSLELDTVTVTVNDLCPLSCPHCYLQYDAETDSPLISPQAVDHIFESSFKRLCIVGKEPFANQESIVATLDIASKAAEQGIEVSVITNGLNLRLLSGEELRKFSWIDISLDGGLNTYQSYRGGNPRKLSSSIDYAIKNCPGRVRFLHTMSNTTINFLDDIIAMSDIFQPAMTLFSPYRPTVSNGVQSVAAIPPRDLITTLQPCIAEIDDSYLAIDSEYLALWPDVDLVEIELLGLKLLGGNFRFLKHDPIKNGFLRVTFDELVMSPVESTHTSRYDSCGRNLLDRSLNDHFRAILDMH